MKGKGSWGVTDDTEGQVRPAACTTGLPGDDVIEQLQTHKTRYQPRKGERRQSSEGRTPGEPSGGTTGERRRTKCVEEKIQPREDF